MELAPPRMQTSLRPQLTIYNYTSLKADVDYRLTFGNFINKLYKSILVTPMHGASFFLSTHKSYRYCDWARYWLAAYQIGGMTEQEESLGRLVTDPKMACVSKQVLSYPYTDLYSEGAILKIFALWRRIAKI